MAAHTHTVRKIHTGYRHRSNRMYGHTCQQPGKVHAVNAGTLRKWGTGYPGWFALCGEFIGRDVEDQDGELVPAPAHPVAEGKTVTCKKCLKAMIGK